MEPGQKVFLTWNPSVVQAAAGRGSGERCRRRGRAMTASGRAASGAIAAPGAASSRGRMLPALLLLPCLIWIAFFFLAPLVADVLAQPRERRILARALRRSLHLAALHQGHDHDGEDREHRHRLRASPGLSPRLRAHHQRRQGARADPGLRSHSVLGRHHRAQLLLADPAGRQRPDQQGADGARHRQRRRCSCSTIRSACCWRWSRSCCRSRPSPCSAPCCGSTAR